MANVATMTADYDRTFILILYSTFILILYSTTFSLSQVANVATMIAGGNVALSVLMSFVSLTASLLAVPLV